MIADCDLCGELTSYFANVDGHMVCRRCEASFSHCEDCGSYMDPDACLKEALELAESILEKWAMFEEDWDDAVALAERVQALNGWLSRGGFKPKGWK